MDMHPADIEPVTMSEILELASWNRPRTSDELQHFINTRHAALPDDIKIE